MPDMLVPLLNLPSLEPEVERMRASGVVVRRARPYEITPVRQFVEAEFGRTWADEITVGYANKPVSVLIALLDGHVVGFAAYECTCRAFFGPTGVTAQHRAKGIGRALLIASLWGLREMGYAYGIIGGAGPTDFYAKTVGAVAIPNSSPGVYADPIRPQDERAGPLDDAGQD